MSLHKTILKDISLTRSSDHLFILRLLMDDIELIQTSDSHLTNQEVSTLIRKRIASAEATQKIVELQSNIHPCVHQDSEAQLEIVILTEYLTERKEDG